ncbi:MAG: radical SAM protein [Spirochaetes bacterium]|nr:radical SAM protein [Spirochaetota bacterium]
MTCRRCETDLSEPKLDLRYCISRMIRLWGKRVIRTVWRTRRLQLGLVRAGINRRRNLRKRDLLVPMGIGISPTARCNLSCRGCYARFHPTDEEMTSAEFRRVVSEAVGAGVFLFVVTGGEPFLRKDLLKIYGEFRSALFWTVTNGTLIDEDTARRIARLGNVVPIVSIEGGEKETDERRGEGVFRRVTAAMSLLRCHGILFGFSSVLTADSIECLGKTEFVSSMREAGCTIGVFNEFIPMSEKDKESLPSAAQKMRFRERLQELREREPIILIHLPYDEYDEAGRCMAVSGGGMHINAKGWVEPCPFAQYARENIGKQSFREVLRSPFLAAIRAHPTLLTHGKIGCSLVNNRDTLEEVARMTGAGPTNGGVRLQESSSPTGGGTKEGVV